MEHKKVLVFIEAHMQTSISAGWKVRDPVDPRLAAVASTDRFLKMQIRPAHLSGVKGFLEVLAQQPGQVEVRTLAGPLQEVHSDAGLRLCFGSLSHRHPSS